MTEDPGAADSRGKLPDAGGVTSTSQAFVTGGEATSTQTKDADLATATIFRDIDTILARLEVGISVQRASMDDLLTRLTGAR